MIKVLGIGIGGISALFAHDCIESGRGSRCGGEFACTR